MVCGEYALAYSTLTWQPGEGEGHVVCIMLCATNLHVNSVMAHVTYLPLADQYLGMVLYMLSRRCLLGQSAPRDGTSHPRGVSIAGSPMAPPSQESRACGSVHGC
eukprot:10390118-Heterocapsa_arctica.AAC.1